MFRLQCLLPGVLIGEGNIDVQQQAKYILKIKGGWDAGGVGANHGDMLNL